MHVIGKILSVAVLAAGLAACGGGEETAPAGEATIADPVAVAAIEARQASLKELGAAFKTINDQVKTSAPDMDAISTAATSISAHAQAVPDWFPAGSGPEAGVETEALPAIWEDEAGFAAAIERLQAASVTMSEAAASGDPAAVGAAIPVLGGSCKNCHDNYRLQDD